MRARFWSLPLLGLLPFAPTCSYSPHPPEGVQQCYEGRCVDGYVCGYDNLCYTPANLPTPPGQGGMVGTGGGIVVGTGGMVGTGGSIALGTGGVIGATGGITTVSTGGVPGTGGIVTATGGIIVGVTGGAVGTGGVVATGGATTPPNAGTSMTIANGQAQGAMTGFGWVALGSADTVTDPTCSSPPGPITGGSTCDFTLWSSPTAYCVTGYLPAVVSSADYSTNWGIQVGVDSTPAEGDRVLGQSFTSVSAQLTGVPLTGLRLIVHRKGDPVGTTYCANMTSGLLVAFTTFNTACWSPTTGTYLAATDVPILDQVSVQVPSGTSAVTISNLCLAGFTFAK
jgi:hypothetical protein